MTYDLLINNGTVVDGTGAPAFEADIAIVGDKIAEIGKLHGNAHRAIDARNLIVVPGFIDPHTHYDAQICWDPMVTSTSWHGVTSVIMGNCGVGIAPCKPEVREIAAWDLVNVEGIPFEALSKGISWDWIGFDEFMNAAQRRVHELIEADPIPTDSLGQRLEWNSFDVDQIPRGDLAHFRFAWRDPHAAIAHDDRGYAMP